jgi:hypothetical protein
VQPNTTRQMAVRAIFATLVNYWTLNLTQAQRDAWDVYAQNVPTTDALGQSITVSGQNWFIGINLPVLQALGERPASGWAILASAPSTFDRGTPLTAVSLEVQSGTAFAITGSIPGGLAQDSGLLLFVGAPQNPGRRFYKGPYRLGFVTMDPDSLAASATTLDTEIAAAATWNSPWGTIGEGDRVPIRVIVPGVDGRTPLAWQGIVEVQAV